MSNAYRGDRRLAKLSGWEIAKKIGCHYSGDMNWLDHGGTFYTLSEVDNGYIPVVRFYGDTVDGLTFYETGSIPIPDDGVWAAIRMVAKCLAQFCPGDQDNLNTPETLPHVLVDYLLFQYGIEGDHFEWLIRSDEPPETDKHDDREPILVGHRIRKDYPREKQLTENQLINRALREGGLLK
jgi:hypothetical protein